MAKFRCWDKVSKKMIYSSVDFNVDMILEDKNRHVMMQSSEHKDKNKKEIYVGDIVLIKTWFSLIKHKEVVEFNKAAIRALGEPVANWLDIEVIGNQFENSELYKEVTSQ